MIGSSLLIKVLLAYAVLVRHSPPYNIMNSCCHQIQDSILETMANTIIREISDNIRQAKYFSLMADEVTNVFNREQVVVCIRWVDGELQSHEDFLGLHKVDDIKIRYHSYYTTRHTNMHESCSR